MTMTNGRVQLQAFESLVRSLTNEACSTFQKISRFYALFHAGFIAICAVESFFFLLFFSFLTRTSVLAFTIALFCLTVFSYFVLHFYHQVKKPQQFREIIDRFKGETQTGLAFAEGSPDLHISIVNAIYELIQTLNTIEYRFYQLPFSKTLEPVMQKLSGWLHWKDVLHMKQMLYKEAIEELFALVRFHPTDLEAHATLAQCYTAYARIYCDPRKIYPAENIDWVAKAYSTLEMRAEFEKIMRLAIEEWTIVSDFSNGDPWVAFQLAEAYRDLEMIDLEMTQYESILKHSPQDREAQMRLGAIYFTQGFSSKGLKIYEQLKKTGDHAKADELLLKYYLPVNGTYQKP